MARPAATKTHDQKRRWRDAAAADGASSHWPQSSTKEWCCVMLLSSDVFVTDRPALCAVVVKCTINFFAVRVIWEHQILL